MKKSLSKYKINRILLYQFREKYEILNTQEAHELKKNISRIKDESIASIDTLISKAVSSFKKNGVTKIVQVNSYEEAEKQLVALLKGKKNIIKSKSNIINRVDIKKVSTAIGVNEILETDIGDFISEVTGQHDAHPVLPSLSLTPEKIVAKFQEKFGVTIEPTPEAIVKWIRNYLRKKIEMAEVGITGANIITSDGEIVLLENEGNISLVSRLPETHIVVTTVEKIVPTIEDAMKISKALAHWGTGQNRVSYVNVITAPSKTADIQNQVIEGAQGAKELIVILIDDRKKLAEKVGKTIHKTGFRDEGFNEILKCINCGACLSLCPAYFLSMAKNEKPQYKGIKEMILDYLDGQADSDMVFSCTTCHMCHEICPVGIRLGDLMLELRNSVEQPKGNKEMFEKVKKFGNPFGEKPEESKEVYCC